jgi:hypothetical protein
VGLNTITLPNVPQYHSFIVCLHIHTGDRSHGSTQKAVQHFHSWWIGDGLSMEGVGLSGYNIEKTQNFAEIIISRVNIAY